MGDLEQQPHPGNSSLLPGKPHRRPRPRPQTRSDSCERLHWPGGIFKPWLHTAPWSRSAPRLMRWSFLCHGSHRKTIWLWLKNRCQNGTLVSGNVDQNLRNPSCLILSHSHLNICLLESFENQVGNQFGDQVENQVRKTICCWLFVWESFVGKRCCFVGRDPCVRFQVCGWEDVWMVLF